MFTKVLETFFRHKLVILAPVIVMSTLVIPIGWFTAPVYYESNAGIWAGTPSVPAAASADPSERYLTPLQVQSTRLSALLRTRWMRDTVASQTSVAGFIGSQAGEDRLQTMLEKDLTITTSGNDLLLLRFRSSSPTLSQQFLSAIIDTYKQKTASDRASSADTAVAFYQGQLQDAQGALDKASAELRRYVAAHPEYTSPTNSIRQVPATAADPTLAAFENNVQYSQKSVQEARAAVQQAQLTGVAALDAQDTTFQVIDAPTTSGRATREAKTLIVLGAAALIIALGLASALLVLLVAGDRTARSETDLGMLPVRVLATLPYLQLAAGKVAAKSLRGAPTTRRAIGFSAGTALPAPSQAAS